MVDQLTWENHEQSERDIFLLSGVPEECIERKNVKVGSFNGEDVFIRTVIINNHLLGADSKPDCVLVHGFGACCGLYYQIVKRVSKYFRFIMIDMVGYGASSRPLNCNF